MTAVSRDAPLRAVRSARAVLPTVGPVSEARIAVGLGAAAALVVVLVAFFPTRTPFTSLMIPLVLGSVVLGPKTLSRFALFVMAMIAVAVLLQEELTSRVVGAAVVQVTIALIVLAGNQRRAKLGVGGARGESMFVDLRDRILTQSGIPEMPDDWLVESALASAGGTPFAGDFVVAARPSGSHRLSVVLVDVSGKGEEAATRALLLSGAMSGLLGAMPASELLPAANGYLVDHAWDEGFATAVHLSIDLITGSYELRAAGHPPPVHRDAGSGRWSVLATEGPVLGVVAGARFGTVRGRLDHGDALILYTDGMVEDSRRDIDLGIDRLLGQAESSLRGSFEGGAQRLVSAVGSPDDDRAIVVVQRR